MAKILLVDDDSDIRILLSELLRLRGYEVEMAESAEDAIQKLRLMPYDIALIDLKLPNMSGDELMEYFKIHQADTQLIIMTGFPSLDTAITALRLGAFDYLTKPFIDTDAIYAVIENALEALKVKRESRKQQRDMEVRFQQLKEVDKTKEILSNIIVEGLSVPVGNIRTTIDFIASKYTNELPVELQGIIETLQEESERAFHIVRRLSDIIMMEDKQLYLNFTSVDLEEVVYQAIKEFSQAKIGERQILMECDPSISEVEADKDILLDIIRNLLSNAVKHTPGKGVIELKTRYLKDKKEVMVTVSDRGPGIAPMYQHKIFEKFGQTELKRAGLKVETGLGLPFCKLAVEAHKGRIWVESLPGKGSAFNFTLPASQK